MKQTLFCSLCNKPLTTNTVYSHNASSCEAKRFPEVPFRLIPKKS